MGLEKAPKCPDRNSSFPWNQPEHPQKEDARFEYPFLESPRARLERGKTRYNTKLIEPVEWQTLCVIQQKSFL
jgi:hypothetical protein